MHDMAHSQIFICMFDCGRIDNNIIYLLYYQLIRIFIPTTTIVVYRNIKEYNNRYLCDSIKNNKQSMLYQHQIHFEVEL